MENNDETGREVIGLNLNHGSLTHLNEIRKLALFIGIVMLALFLMICLSMLAIIIIGLIQNGFFTGTTTLIAGISLIVVSVVYLLAFIYLSRFAGRMREAETGNDRDKLEKAFLNMKYFFRLIAIVLIVYIIGFVVLISTKMLF
ncbi:MAG: hypothetical protein R6W67_06380 [Bacteroidales bacterium]